jgi:DNA ligase-1
VPDVLHPPLLPQVWELRGADLTLSPVHRGAVGRIPGSDRGVALRFPRFIRVREDKSVEDASGPDVLVQVGTDGCQAVQDMQLLMACYQQC